MKIQKNKFNYLHMKTILTIISATLFYLVINLMPLPAQDVNFYPKIKTIVLENGAELRICSGEKNHLRFDEEDYSPDFVKNHVRYNEIDESITISVIDADLCLAPDTKISRIEVNAASTLEGKIESPTIYADTLTLSAAYSADVSLSIATKELSVSVSGASDMSLGIKAENVNTWVNGASDLFMDISCSNLYISASGASDVTAKGDVNYAKVVLSGASDLSASNLKVEILDSYTSGMSFANIKGNNTILDVRDSVSTYFDKNFEKKKEGKTYSDYFNLDLNNFARQKQRYKFKGHWMGIEAGYNYYASNLSREHPMTLDYGKSGSFAWNVFQYSVGFNSRHIGFVTGAGFLWNNYRFEDSRMTPIAEDGKFVPTVNEDPNRFYDKSKLTVSYFRIPLLIEYTNARKYWRNFHASVGAIAGVRMCTWTKQLYKVQGQSGTERAKTKGDFYVNPFRVDLVSYVGIGPLNVYFSYALTDLFLKDKGPQVTPFAFGFFLGIG